jgi:hypothetical protein
MDEEGGTTMRSSRTTLLAGGAVAALAFAAGVALGAGEAGEARTAFRRALTLDRFLRDQVPEEMRPAQSRRRLRSPARRGRS